MSEHEESRRVDLLRLALAFVAPPLVTLVGFVLLKLTTRLIPSLDAGVGSYTSLPGWGGVFVGVANFWASGLKWRGVWVVPYTAFALAGLFLLSLYCAGWFFDLWL